MYMRNKALLLAEQRSLRSMDAAVQADLHDLMCAASCGLLLVSTRVLSSFSCSIWLHRLTHHRPGIRAVVALKDKEVGPPFDTSYANWLSSCYWVFGSCVQVLSLAAGHRHDLWESVGTCQPLLISLELWLCVVPCVMLI